MMKEVLTIIAGIVLTAQAPIGLSFFIPCLWEKEKRVSFFVGLRIVGMLFMLFLFLYLTGTGVFQTTFGASLLAFTLSTDAVLGFCLRGDAYMIRQG
jgi:hypothetical protein